MYTKNINAVMLDNYNYRTPESGNWDRFSGSDNRLIYPSTFRYYTNFTNSTVLTNTNEGYGYTFNITLNAQPVKNLNLMAAYTRTEMKEVSGMPGSNATSAWVNLYTVDGPNLSKVQRSQYVTPDQVIGSMSYQIPYLKNHMGSTISLFYRGFSPYGNSYAYSNDMNGDGISNDLMYIPKEPDDIKFRDITKTEDGTVTVVNTAKDQSDAFFAFMEQDSYLKKNKGNYAEAYAARPPFVHKFDLRFLQDFSVKVGQTRNTLQLSVDILNVGNLLKSTWGVNQSNTASGSGQILRYAGRDANNAPTYTLNKVNVTQTYAGDFPTKTYSNLLNYNQCWSLQIGLRYIFN
jgi:hypothetical protein